VIEHAVQSRAEQDSSRSDALLISYDMPPAAAPSCRTLQRTVLALEAMHFPRHRHTRRYGVRNERPFLTACGCVPNSLEKKASSDRSTSGFGRKTRPTSSPPPAAGAVTLSAVAILGGRPEDGAGSETAGAPGCTPASCRGRTGGHALFSPVIVSTDTGEVQLLGMGPLAVSPPNSTAASGQ